MFRFEKLDVWKMAIVYANKVYDLMELLPRNEDFGLKSQLKRAVLSVSSNIAEGSGSATMKDFSNYLDISIKSTIETVSQLSFAKERGYINQVQLLELYNEAEILVKKIQSLKQYLKKPRAIRHDSRADMEASHG